MLDTPAATVNRFIDRAGRHRRIAICFALATLPALIMGWSVLADHRLFAAYHVVAAASLLWVSVALIRRGAFVDGAGMPPAALGALVGSLVLIRLSAPASVSQGLGGELPLILSHVVLLLALGVLIVGDRRLDPVAMFIGRMLLVLGGLLFGLTQVFRLFNGLDTQLWYSIGVGLVGLIFLCLSLSEARLVRRALQLLAADY